MGGSSVSLLKPSNSFIIFVSILVLQACHHRLIICQVMPPSPPPSQDLMFLDQRLAAVYPVIQQFKNTITADPSGITNSWVGPGICNYTGFYCDNPPDNLTATALAGIDFNGYHLGAPTLEGFLDQLPDLAIFHANSNNISGVIPQKIAQLPYFYELDVSNNNFSGAFPAAVFGVNLSFLDIRFNSFTGSVPPQVFKQALDVLYINNNKFMQKIPIDFGSTRVLYLTLANNKFTGLIPRSIANASSTLIEVLFLNNQLMGCIPYEIGFLRKATVFDAGDNYLTGQLPCSLGCLDMIEQLNFAGNFLYDAIPEVVCSMPQLSNLSLSDNYFNHIGPLCWKLVKRGVLDVRMNCIFGLPNQRPHYECVKFYFHSFWFRWVCPWQYLMSAIPCKINSSYISRPPGARTASATYPALNRHRLL